MVGRKNWETIAYRATYGRLAYSDELESNGVGAEVWVDEVTEGRWRFMATRRK